MKKSVTAFTLIEMLVVIAILGILAALTVPVLKNFGRSDATIGASRQLLDGVARARQLAISERTTVYMVFIPPGFWDPTWVTAGTPTPAWTTGLTPAQKIAVTNLLDKQFTGYTFISLRSMGDQPGHPVPSYLGSWQTLPDGAFIETNKFMVPVQYYSITQYDSKCLRFPVSQPMWLFRFPPWIQPNKCCCRGSRSTTSASSRPRGGHGHGRRIHPDCEGQCSVCPERRQPSVPVHRRMLRKIRPATASIPTTSSTLTG